MSQHYGFLEGIIPALSPSPGRANHVIRALISSAVVIILSQSLQVPLLALSLIVVFFVTQTNVILTKLTGILFITGTTLAVTLSLIILKVTWDIPLLRILLTFCVFLSCVFLMRTTNFGVVFFIIAIVVIYTQSLVDITPSSELLVKGILWVWLAVNYPIAITLVVNTLIMPAEPYKQLLTAIRNQLALIVSKLEFDADSVKMRDSVERVSLDTQALYRLLRYTVMRCKESCFDEQRYLALISIVSELRTSTCLLPEVMKRDDGLTELINAIKLLSSTAEKPELFSLRNISLTVGTYSEISRISEMLIDYARSNDSLKSVDKNDKISRCQFLVKDAFTNRNYILFALKTCLSAAVCYLFYTATDWAGIHTIMLSCLIVAQPGLGNTQRKIILRISGAAVGSLLALITIVYLIPHVDTLFGLLGIVLPVVVLSSWVTTGPESISYAGIQIVFTFSLALLESFGPVIELTEVRDRLVGIILGIIIAGIVHTLIAPEREGAVLLQRLSSVAAGMASWLKIAVVPVQNRSSVFLELAECEALASRVALEPSWDRSEGTHDSLHQMEINILIFMKNLLIFTDEFSHEINNLGANVPAGIEEQAYAIAQQYYDNFQFIKAKLEGGAIKHGSLHFSKVLNSLPEHLRSAGEGIEIFQKKILEYIERK